MAIASRAAQQSDWPILRRRKNRYKADSTLK
jgi:hypothetical protein